MATCITHSAEETAGLGEAWGRAARAGWVLGLCGDLGAGKTQLVKGFAPGLGISARVQSPTFALVNIYEGGRLKLYHLDLYRLDTRDQIQGMGIEDYLQPDGVTVIEWVERWWEGAGAWRTGDPRAIAPAGAAACRLVWMETLDETERRITYEDFSA